MDPFAGAATVMPHPSCFCERPCRFLPGRSDQGNGSDGNGGPSNAAPPRSLARGSAVGHRLTEFFEIVEPGVVVLEVDNRPAGGDGRHAGPAGPALRTGVLGPDLPRALQPFHPFLP